MFGKMKVLALTGALAATAFAATGAQAAGWIVGLVDGKSIVTIDPASRKVASKVEVKGAGPLTGIDVRPADGMLYGVAADGTIFTIDIKSGQATMKSNSQARRDRYRRLQPGCRSLAGDGLRRHQPPRQCR